MSDTEAPAGFEPRDAKELASLFPGYEIKHLVATGGMGAVYCAVQKSLDRVVAIKILPVEFSNDPDFCAAFESEAKAMAKLNHPNLIGVFDFGEVAGMLYIIMEYVEGETLFNITQGGIIKSSESLRLMQGICAGVASAHQHGILHRDIKPANILLDAHLQPKIGDFGLARPVDREIQDGEMIFGTPGYTAPEVIEPPHVFDQRADIFSLGVMLHELITGKLPDDDPRPASAQVRCHPRVDLVIRKATQQDPEKRFQTAADMADELAKISKPGLTKATTAIKLPSAAGTPTSPLATAGSSAAPQSQGDMLRARQQPQAAAQGVASPALRRAPGAGGALVMGGGGAALATPPTGGMNTAPQATGAVGGHGQTGALGGAPSTIMMSSKDNSNTVVWVIVIVLAFFGVVVLMVKSGDDGKPSPQQQQPSGLDQMLNSQIGSGDDGLSDTPGPGTPKPAPKPVEDPEDPLGD